MCYNHTGVTVRIKRLTSTESRDRREGCRRFRSSLCRIPPKFINIFILYATFLSFRSIFLFPKSFLHTVMAASSRKVAGKRSIISRSVENEKLAELVKLAVAEAIKQAIPTLVEDVVAQLTSKTQALVDAQVAVFHGEMIAMQADISKCMDCIEKGENRWAEVDSQLSASANRLAIYHAPLEDKMADMEDRSRRDNIRVHGVPENADIACSCLPVGCHSMEVSRAGFS